MKCDKVKKILLLDYMDSEGSVEMREKVEKHLEVCESCRKAYLALRKKVKTPFREAAQVAPPDFVWEKIRNNIYGQTDTEGVNVFLEKLKELLVFRKPVLALVSILLLVVIGVKGVQLHDYNLNKEFISQQMEYVMVSYGQEDIGDSEGFGSSIEEYFF